jgi:integrase/recombinase XerC
MDDSARQWPERFLNSLKHERRLSAHTSDAYAHDISEFVEFCTQQSITNWTELDGQHIRQFAAREHRRGIAPRSIQRRLSAIRSLCNFLVRERVIKNNPASAVRAPKVKKRLPVTVDADQMTRLLSFQAETLLDKRDKAIMELFYSSGLRLSELVNLDVLDIDLKDQTLRVEHGKGNKSRIVPVGRYAVAALQDWLHERALLNGGDTNAVFVSELGKRLTPRAIQLRISQWAIKQGLPQHLHPHLFRHSFASHILESSQDLRGVQELLGHANISTTQVYTHLDFQHLAKIYDAAHPRARVQRKT